MKKSNILTAVLAVVCCISIVISGVSLSYAIETKSMAENIGDTVYDKSSIDYELESINEELDSINESLDIPVDYYYSVGDNVIWREIPVQQAYVEVSTDYLCLEAGRFVEAVAAFNMTMPENNSNVHSNRYYQFENPDEVGYLIVRGVESGIAILTVAKVTE